MRRRATAAVAGALALAVAIGAHAQAPAPPRGTMQSPLMVALPANVSLSQHPVPALSGSQLDQLMKATTLRDAGLLDPARELLVGLLAEVPHHALVLSELAKVDLARQDFAGVVRLGRAERASQKDSVLLGRELVLALERLARPREATQVALEMWIASPQHADWSTAVFQRLGPTDSKGVREVLRGAVSRFPARLDLARGLAHLEWQAGDARTALKTLAAADRSAPGPGARWGFAEELLRRATSRDSSGALDVLLELAADPAREATYRLMSSRRAWEIARVRGAEPEIAPRVAVALADLPATRWPAEFVAEVARGLRHAGQTDAARALLKARGATLTPQLAVEQALNDLRDGPPERAIAVLEAQAARDPEAAFRHAEALFFSGRHDSALAAYQRIAEKPSGPHAGAALERIYLIEDAQPPTALPAFGRLAYEEWRGDAKRATAIADSLYRTLPRGPLWAQAALALSGRLESSGDARGAIAPLLAVADSLPEDRLAPLARQRAGEIYQLRLNEDAKALEQFEECLARYPRAWNAPEVRRKLEALRRARRF